MTGTYFSEILAIKKLIIITCLTRLGTMVKIKRLGWGGARGVKKTLYANFS
jgi:hypothetical protein